VKFEILNNQINIFQIKKFVFILQKSFGNNPEIVGDNGENTGNSVSVFTFIVIKNSPVLTMILLVMMRIMMIIVVIVVG
jgi:hypothetical protein